MIKKMYFVFIAIILAVVLVAGCANQTSTNTGSGNDTTQIGDLEISSTAFTDGGDIPVSYSGDGDGISPPLSFSNVPDDAETLVLIMDDPDAQGGTYLHWLVFDTLN